MMNINIEVQYVYQDAQCPDEEAIIQWTEQVLEDYVAISGEMVIRIVDKIESARLNEVYRKKVGPTNVLAFEYGVEERERFGLIGDLAICAPIVMEEAEQQHKNLLSHWAHMVVHGTLHLLGFDHIDENDAEIMRDKEIIYLKKLDFDNPYEEEKTL